MSLIATITRLPVRTRAIVGISFLVWGSIGLYLSDTAEKKLGFEPGGERDPIMKDAGKGEGGWGIRVVEREGSGVVEGEGKGVR